MVLFGRSTPTFGSTVTGLPVLSKAVVGCPAEVIGSTFDEVNACSATWIGRWYWNGSGYLAPVVSTISLSSDQHWCVWTEPSFFARLDCGAVFPVAGLR